VNMTGAKLEFFGEVARLDVLPGDVFVLTVPHDITPEVVRLLKKAWAEAWAGDEPLPRMMMLINGMKVGIIRRKKDQPENVA